MRTESGSASHDPYWWGTAPREAPSGVALPKSCDVAIIGAGQHDASDRRPAPLAGAMNRASVSS